MSATEDAIRLVGVELRSRLQRILGSDNVRYSDYRSTREEYESLIKLAGELQIPLITEVTRQLEAVRLRAKISVSSEVEHLKELLSDLDRPVALPELVKVALVQPPETVSSTRNPPEDPAIPATRINNDLKHDGVVQAILALLTQHDGTDLTYDRIYEEFPSYDHRYIMNTLGHLKKRGVKEGRLVGGYGKIRFEKSDSQTSPKDNTDGQSDIPPTEVKLSHGVKPVRHEQTGKRSYLDKDHIRGFPDIYQEVSGVYGNASFADILQGMNGFHSALVNFTEYLMINAEAEDFQKF